MATTYPAYLPVLLFSLLSSACGDEGPVVTVGDVMFDDPELQQCFEQGFLPFPDDADVRLVQQLDCGLPAHDIQDLTGIEILSGLGRLSLTKQTGIDDYSPILNLPNLVELELPESRVENRDLEVISKLNNLEWLILDQTDLGNVSSLSRLTNLTYLSLVKSQVTSGLASLIDLKKLMHGYFGVNPESPCADLEILREALPDAVIEPVAPTAGVSCSE